MTPYISVTLGNFPEIFSLSDTSPQALPISLCYPTNSTSGLGVGPPKKKLFDPQLHKILWIDFAVFWHNDPSWGPLETTQIWLQSGERILRNWGKTDLSDFVFRISSRKAKFGATCRTHLPNYLDNFIQIIRTGYSEATVKISSPQPLPKWRGGTSNIASRDIFAVAGLRRFQPDFGL